MKQFILALTLPLIVTLAACNQTSQEPESSAQVETAGTAGDNQSIQILIGNQTFFGELYDNDAAKTLAQKLPLTLNMRDLNGNEKYYYFSEDFPTDSSKPQAIHAGDLMLFGSDCLVLFYENFSTSYSYTPLGRVENPEGLAGMLGSGDVQVTLK